MFIQIQVREKGQYAAALRIPDSDIVTGEDGSMYATVEADKLLELAGLVQEARNATFTPAPQEQLKTEADHQDAASDTPMSLINTRDLQIGQRVRIKFGSDESSIYEGVITQKGIEPDGGNAPDSSDSIIFTTDTGETKFALGEVPGEVLSEETPAAE